jgi:hypothetical protein
MTEEELFNHVKSAVILARGSGHIEANNIANALMPLCKDIARRSAEDMRERAAKIAEIQPTDDHVDWAATIRALPIEDAKT